MKQKTKSKSVKKVNEVKVEKDYYSTLELVAQSWFPVRSTITLKKLIENGELRAVNISTTKKCKRYRIDNDSVQEFMYGRYDKKIKREKVKSNKK